MSISYTARQTELTPNLKKYCEKRIASLEKLFGYPLETNLVLSVEKYRNKVEVNVKTKGATLNAVSETQDMFSSLGDVFDNIERRAKKEKEKLRERKRRKIKDTAGDIPGEEAPQNAKRIIRSRSYSMKPMSVEEALIFFESKNHEVQVFRNFETDRWAVLYRRKDGNYGLIEPE